MTKAEMQKELEYQLGTITNLQRQVRLAKQDEMELQADYDHLESELRAREDYLESQLRARQNECQRHLHTIDALKRAMKVLL